MQKVEIERERGWWTKEGTDMGGHRDLCSGEHPPERTQTKGIAINGFCTISSHFFSHPCPMSTPPSDFLVSRHWLVEKREQGAETKAHENEREKGERGREIPQRGCFCFSKSQPPHPLLWHVHGIKTISFFTRIFFFSLLFLFLLFSCYFIYSLPVIYVYYRKNRVLTCTF